MKQNLNKNILNIIKVGLFLGFLMVEVLGLSPKRVFAYNSCSAANQTCPTGLTCVVPDGQCEQQCSGPTDPVCSPLGDSCNTQGYCTPGGQPSGQGSTPTNSTPSFSISPSKTSYQMGDSLIIAFNNMPAGWSGKIKINTGAVQACSQNSTNICIITLSTNIGAVDNSANTISVGALDGNGNLITNFAANQKTITIGTPSNSPTPASNNSSATLYNPLPENDLTHVFLLITKSFLDIMGIWAVMFIIFGGFQMVLSSGNEEAYAKAKKTITWAVLGLAVALLSFSIVAIVEDLLQANIQAPTTTTNTTTTPPNNAPSNPTPPNNAPPNTTPGN